MKKSLILTGACAAFIFAAAPQAHGCTSWMVFSDMTKNNTNILHKNRDSNAKTVNAYLSAPGAKRKWVALSGSSTSVNSGINISGLAAAVNSGEPCLDPPDKNPKGMSTPRILCVILESCDTAKQAVAKLQEILKSGDYYHNKSGSTFFFCDTKEGYVCEMTGKYCSVQRFDRGFTVRANIWQNPNMYELSRNDVVSYFHSTTRVYVTMNMLNTAMDKNKRVDIQDHLEISRHYLMPEKSPLKRSLCGKNTLSGTTMEIDREYPGELSVIYATIGFPRNTLCIPLPICAGKLHPAMGDSRWYQAAKKHYDKHFYRIPIQDSWIKFEKESYAKMAAAKAQARKLLKAGKRAEAIKRINTTAEGIWKDAAALLGIK